MTRAYPSLAAQPAERHYLTTQLLAFYAELVTLKQCADLPDADAMAARLTGLLEAQDAALQEHELLQNQANHQDARYLKVALADEVVIGLAQWEHHHAWLSRPLEMRLYDSRCAGERVFGAIELLLREEVAARRVMGTLYLLVLAMGFRGRYAAADHEAGARRLRQLRVQLYRYARDSAAEPALMAAGERTSAELTRSLLPQVYAYTVTDPAPSLLPDPRRWRWIFAGAAALLLLVANLIWHYHTDPLARYLVEQTPASASASGPAATPVASGR